VLVLVKSRQQTGACIEKRLGSVHRRFISWTILPLKMNRLLSGARTVGGLAIGVGVVVEFFIYDGTDTE
jgi:hypothetical protein